MDGYWPPTLGLAADIISLLGFALTIYIAGQTKQIKRHFFSKVRLREALPELKDEVEGYLASLSNWSEDARNELTTQKFNSVRVMLLTLKGKVSSIELSEINSTLNLMWTRKWFAKRKIAHMTLDECWELADKMNAVVVILDQKIKDLNWTDK